MIKIVSQHTDPFDVKNAIHTRPSIRYAQKTSPCKERNQIVLEPYLTHQKICMIPIIEAFNGAIAGMA